MIIPIRISLTRRFVAAHSLPEIGVAARHSHPYEVECARTVGLDRAAGCERPLDALAAEVDAVLGPLQGSYLNDLMPHPPTAEVLACWILERLPHEWASVTVRAYDGYACTVTRDDLHSAR